MASNQNPAADWFKMFSDFKTPMFDFNNLANQGRRNVETMVTVGQLFTETAQVIGRRQAEAAREHVEHFIKASKDMLSGNAPELSASKQADYAKTSMENAVSNMREMAELASKASTEAFQVMNRRMTENMEELNRTATATTKRKNAA